VKTDFLSTRQVAESLGVSESSLKRWCDRGVLPSVRTAGGHRRLPLTGVIQFVRNSNFDLQGPELIGLPSAGEQLPGGFQRGSGLVSALEQGDLEHARQTLVGRFLSGDSVAEIADQVIAPALWEIGHQWEAGDVEIYQEHRATEIVSRVLHEIYRLLPTNPTNSPLALGGAPENDSYRIPTQLVELILAENGWRATSLGSKLPLPSLRLAIDRNQPELVWLTISHVDDKDAFLNELRELVVALPTDLPVVIGGRMVDDEIRQCFGQAMYCQDMRQLATFAKSLYKALDP
jgi:excisionase family DNA binding protein